MSEESKDKIKKLIEKYEEAKTSGRLGSYTEQETKMGFIEPLFEALGWDFRNKKEVSGEETITLAGRVDFGFYLNDRPKFYLEAKSFSADIHDEKFANQAIRYSFNKGAVWAVLTNFETLIVFNAQNIKGNLSDKRFFTLHYNEYIDKFDKLWRLSREAFENDLLDKYGDEVGKKIEKVSVTSLLHRDLQECRDLLIKYLGAWNDKVDPDLLDQGVQKLLDRLLFIRVAEDRGIEPLTLIPMARQARNERGGELYQAMIKKFREFDDLYNSNLFSPHPFEKWEDVEHATEKVIRILYGKEGYYEYDFKAMPADVLGAVYENYLSHRLSKSRKGTTISKDATKRKEQGIYYTPNYIVDYIVKNALGPVLDRCKTIEDIKKIKVLDPACGSGSFLIKAFELIFQKCKEDFNFRGQENLLKIQILEENIYGVDLDQQAVEITRLNLLINALTKREKLPLLGNIKNGNSLTFNWRGEFSEVFKQGGFDVIIGNPPYIKEFVNKSAFDELHESPYYQGKMDIWTMFACICIDLLKNSGVLSLIAPNNWVTNAGASIFRDKILKDGELKTFIDFGDYRVFEQAGIQTMIFAFEKKKPGKNYKVDYLKITDKDMAEDKLIADIFRKKTKIDIEPEELLGKNITFSTPEYGSIFDKIKMKRNFELTDKEVGQGIVAPQESVIKSHLSIVSEIALGEGIFVLNKKDIDKLGLSQNDKKILKPFYTSEQINKYYVQPENKHWIIYTTSKLAKEINKYPKIKQHLEKFKNVITSSFGPFGLHRAREEKFFIGPSIFSIRKTDMTRFSYVDFPCYVSQTYFVINTNRCNLKYLSGLLNSKLINFWLHGQGKLQGDMLQIDKEPLMNIPIRIGSEKQQKQIIILVNKMLELNKDIKEVTENSDKWNSIKSEIEKTDKKIDGEVYELYALVDDEVKIVENSTKK